MFTWVGYAAGTLTTIAFLPQVLHVWKTKSAEDLHLGTLVCFTMGISLWLTVWDRHAADAGDSTERSDTGAASLDYFSEAALCAGKEKHLGLTLG